MTTPEVPSIDGDRLWSTILHTASMGATGRGGLCRLAGSDADGAVRDWFVAAARDAGCYVDVDPIGNVFATRPGRVADRAAVSCGSHLDTQPTGGRFDGVLGVLAGLEVLRSLNDRAIETEAPITVINWTNEEGSRFAPGIMGSSVHRGLVELSRALAAQDADGRTLGACLQQIGYAGDAPLGGRSLDSYFELHIEQGPVLEAEGQTIGVVTGAQGLRWYDVSVFGTGGHAGTVPMALRRDAMMAAADLITQIRMVATDRNRPAVATVGRLNIPGASRNTIPGTVELTVDIRHPHAETLDAIEKGLRAALESVSHRHGVEITLAKASDTPPVAFDADCVAAVRSGAQALGLSHMDITSGAGHDACVMAGAVPTGMIFVPCKDGVSHQEREDMTQADAAAGAAVLFEAMLARAGRAT